jgi:hypothetical protein
MENKKIKNATKTTSSGIEFKSYLESMIYKTLVEKGITPLYEKRTFEFVPKIRPTIPFYNRVNKVFTLDSKPLRPITYTPDFTFEHNGILIIIEAKGFENDVYPVKKNLFRRYLENLNQPAMFFEIRTKKELLVALNLINMESLQVQRLRKLIPSLPEKDISIGMKLLEARDWGELYNLVSSAIVKVERSNANEDGKYSDIDIASLYRLQSEIPESLDDYE